MDPLIVLLVMAVVAAIATAALKSRSKKADASPANEEALKDAEEKYAARCGEGEEVRVVCRADYKKPYFYALTTKRLILDTAKPAEMRLVYIKSVKLLNMSGYKTDPENAVRVVIKADKKYTLFRYSEQFTNLAIGLSKLV